MKIRENTKQFYEACQHDTKARNYLEYEQAKKASIKEYNDAWENDLSNKIEEVEKANINCKQERRWHLINYISRRKDSQKGLIKGNTNEKGLRTSPLIFRIFLAAHR